MAIKIDDKTVADLLETARMWRGYNDYDSYRAEDDYELLEYLKVKPEYSGLDVTLWVDDGTSYAAHNHPMWLYLDDKENNILIPISVCKNPQIMIPGYDELDIRKIKRFILNNLENLIKLANEEIININFVKSIIKTITESYGIINEMSKMLPNDTGLPVEIWVDEGTHPKHGKRIKFRASKEQRKTTEYTSMTISDNPIVFNLPDKGCISNKEINLIRQFVVYNKDLLLDLVDGLIVYQNDFLDNLIRIGKNGGPIYPQSFFDKPITYKDN